MRLLERQRFARRVEAVEPLRNFVDLIADPVECAGEAQAIGGKPFR